MSESGKVDEPTWVARVLAANLRTLLDYAATVPRMADRSTYTGLEAYILSQPWGGTFGKSTIGRIVNAQTNPQLDDLRLIAKALEVEPWHLLVPGLDPRSLPDLVTDEPTREFLRTLTGAKTKLGSAARVVQKISSGDAGGDHDYSPGTDGDGNDAGSSSPRKPRVKRRQRKPRGPHA